MTPPTREVKVLACPDPECGHIEQLDDHKAKGIKGNPPCPRVYHRKTGNYRRLQRADAQITMEKAPRKRRLRAA